ncbi:MAG: LytTR family DNA-binding domain-containing protein [Chitinophagaceae bacterium]
MKVLILEDESLSARHLKKMLQSIDGNIEVVAVLDSIEACTRFFTEPAAFDLVLMDIELGDGQSFAVMELLPEDCPVIFVTGHQEHALKAFKLNSLDYLLKPLNRDDLEAALDKFRNLYQPKKQLTVESYMRRGQVQAHAVNYRTRYLVKCGTRLISISLSDVAYFYTKGKIQYVKTRHNEDFIIDKRLEEIEMEVDGSSFFRVNRQFIVSYMHIERVHTWFSGKLKVQVQPAAYEEIIVSRLKANEFKKWLGE